MTLIANDTGGSGIAEAFSVIVYQLPRVLLSHQSSLSDSSVVLSLIP